VFGKIGTLGQRVLEGGKFGTDLDRRSRPIALDILEVRVEVDLF